MSLVFVYGTLKRGDIRAGALLHQVFLGTAHTEPMYRLRDCGEYPGLIAVPAAGLSIEGEVYDVTPECLRRLDEVEGVAEQLYARRPVSLRPPYADQSVEAYFYLWETSDLPDCGTRWDPRIRGA
ncbi:MAG: gamma-glutamylcyclotransferase [Planctomycetaceae bacterium]